jgi:2-hydroxychromene-2-carboxylate isomerase
MAAADDTVRFYFSFRSPYSWLAFLRIERALGSLPVVLEYVPVFPPKDFPNDPAAVPNKLRYIREDVARIAQAYGYRTATGFAIDTDWIRPHAAFVYAADQGRARAFGLALHSARFEDGLDVGDNGVMRDVAVKLSLDPDAVVAAADDEQHQTRVVQGMITAATEDSIFGVPYFVYRGETFWGNDRIHWLIRAIRKAHGQPVVDLRQDFLQALDRS